MRPLPFINLFQRLNNPLKLSASGKKEAKQSIGEYLRQLSVPLLLSTYLTGCANPDNSQLQAPTPSTQSVSQNKAAENFLIPDLDTVIEAAKKGQIKSVEFYADDSLGSAYFVTYLNGKTGVTPIDKQEKDKGKILYEVLQNSSPAIPITKKHIVKITEMDIEKKAALISLALIPLFLVLVVASLYAGKRFEVVKSNTTFDDVRGNSENIAKLKTLIGLLKNKNNLLGAKAPKGILLVGPKGTGKTLTARAIAGEMGYNFIACDSSDFASMYMGVGSFVLKRLFKTAKQKAPCIIFIDEIDELGSKRSFKEGDRAGNQNVNALLTLMDGFKKNDNVIVIGATNRLHALDSALLRPGRFDEILEIKNPVTVEERQDILDLYLEKKRQQKVKIDPTITALEIAKITPRFSPAELEAVVNRAAINVLHLAKDSIGWDDVHEAIDQVQLGEIVSVNHHTDEDKLRLVAHEFFGHFLMAILLGQDVSKISFVPRVKALAHVTTKERPGLGLMTKSNLIEEILLLLAGSAAEKHYLGETSTGSDDDMNKVRKLLKAMLVNNMLGSFTMHLDEGKKERPLSKTDREKTEKFFEDLFNKCFEVLKQFDPAKAKENFEKILNQKVISGDAANVLAREIFGADVISDLSQQVKAMVQELAK